MDFTSLYSWIEITPLIFKRWSPRADLQKMIFGHWFPSDDIQETISDIALRAPTFKVHFPKQISYYLWSWPDYLSLIIFHLDNHNILKSFLPILSIVYRMYSCITSYLNLFLRMSSSYKNRLKLVYKWAIFSDKSTQLVLLVFLPVNSTSLLL